MSDEPTPRTASVFDDRGREVLPPWSGVTNAPPTRCGWCDASSTFSVLDPDWREGGLVGFCSEDHLRWYTYLVTA